MSLTPKQAAFVEEYLIDLNATQAAIRAGYAAGSASVEGSRLLANAKIAEAVAKAKAERSEETRITAESVLGRLNQVADRCMQAEPVLTRDGKETGEYTFQSAGANKALELLGKHLALFTDRIQADVETTVTEIVRKVVDPKEGE